jgi:N-glycosylase/DNA lyase
MTMGAREAARRTPGAILEAAEFDLRQTLESGQVFHWEEVGAGYLGLIGRKPVHVEQRGSALWVRGPGAELVPDYFALDHPLGAIHASFPADPAMRAALECCRGLRIIRQPAWECVATFITSSMKQVAHIRQMSAAMRERFGEPVEFEGGRLFAFPTPARLSAVSEVALRECGLGYRAKNLLGAALLIASGEVDLAALRALDDDAARAELCRLPGVGPKVANCALLFAFERLRAFPIDVWIERVLRETYFKRKRKVTAARLRKFCDSYFGEFGGYAQQYLFHHARSTRRKKAPK